jgi:hypothetical protein
MDPRYKSPETHVVLQNQKDDFLDISRLTTILGWMLLVGAASALLAVWSNWMQLQLLSHQYTLQEAQANDLRERSITMSALGVTIACIFVFGRWIFVAHRNLTALGARELDVTPGAAIGWFFVPIANLWKPYQAMRTLWKASHDPQHWPSASGNAVLVIWWTLWIISSVLGSAFFRLSLHPSTIPELLDATRAVLINSAIDIPQYLVAWLLVRRIWDAQVAQRTRQVAGERATPLQDVVAPA